MGEESLKLLETRGPVTTAIPSSMKILQALCIALTVASVLSCGVIEIQNARAGTFLPRTPPVTTKWRVLATDSSEVSNLEISEEKELARLRSMIMSIGLPQYLLIPAVL